MYSELEGTTKTPRIEAKKKETQKTKWKEEEKKKLSHLICENRFQFLKRLMNFWDFFCAVILI